VFMEFLGEIQKVIARAKEIKGLESLAENLETAVNRLGGVAMHMGKTAMSPDFKVAFSHALPFLDVMGDMIMAWMLLWRAVVASEKLGNGAKKKDTAFYQGELKTAEFFIQTELPQTMGRMEAIGSGCKAAIEIGDESFGGL